MNRRSFLKSVAGFVATVAASTVVRPAKAAYRVVQRFTTRKVVAGEDIWPGQFVTIRDGKAYRAGASDTPAGFAFKTTHKGKPIEIVTGGCIEAGSFTATVPPRYVFHDKTLNQSIELPSHWFNESN